MCSHESRLDPEPTQEYLEKALKEFSQTLSGNITVMLRGLAIVAIGGQIHRLIDNLKALKKRLR
jgi:hypothetical protein